MFSECMFNGPLCDGRALLLNFSHASDAAVSILGTFDSFVLSLGVIGTSVKFAGSRSSRGVGVWPGTACEHSSAMPLSLPDSFS